MQERISWQEYGLLLAEVASIRSQDRHSKNGACVLGKDGSVLSLGYNGLPSKVEIDFWEDRDRRREYVIHAEQNALAKIKPHGNIWCICITMPPCKNCLKAIAAHGIKEIYYNRDYSSDTYDFAETKEIADRFGIKMRQIKMEPIISNLLKQL